MNIVGDAWIEVKAAAENFERDLGDKTRTAADKAGTSSGSAFAAGLNTGVGKAVAAASAAVAGFALLAANSWKKATNEIIVESGRSGEAARALMQDLKSVASSGVTTSIDRIGDVIGKLAARTKLAGEPMRELARQIVLLDELQPGFADSVDTLVDLFKAWGVATEDQTGLLDFLFRASQKSGMSVADLVAEAQSTGPTFRAFNFSLEESVALLAKTGREGASASKLIASLRIAIGKLSDAPGGAEGALAALVRRIEEADSASEATSLAVDALGSRAGPAFASSVRAGRFEIENFLEVLRNGNNTIEATRERTTTLMDRFNQLKNRVLATVGPMANSAAVIATIATGAPVAVSAISALGNAYRGLAVMAALANTSVLAISWGAVVSGVTAVGAAIAAAMPWLIAIGAAVAAVVVPWKAYTAAQKEAEKATSSSVRLVEQLVLSMAKGALTTEEATTRISQAINDQNLSLEESGRVAEAARSALESYNQANRDGKNPVSALLSEVEGLAEAHRQQAEAAREARLAELALAGGFLGIQGAVLGARSASMRLRETQAEVDKLLSKGKKGTDEYRAAMLALKESQLAAVESQIGLEDSILTYAQELSDANTKQRVINATVREMGKEAGLSREQIDRLIVKVLELTRPDHTMRFKEEGLSGILRDLNQLGNVLRDLPNVLLPSVVPGGGGGGNGGGGNNNGGGGGNNNSPPVPWRSAVEIELDGKLIYETNEAVGRRHRVRFSGRDDG